MTMTEAVDRIVADLEQNPPAALTEARTPATRAGSHASWLH